MNKLFENVGSNRFKLITESTDEAVPKSTLVREGLKKVLASGGKEVSYNQLETVGMGYIRSIEEAKKCALKEARELALEFGYKDDENNAKFVKEAATGEWNQESSHDETDMSNSEESREVEIGKEILRLSDYLVPDRHDQTDALIRLKGLANELIKMHGAK
jgi:hypothetical protein